AEPVVQGVGVADGVAGLVHHAELGRLVRFLDRHEFERPQARFDLGCRRGLGGIEIGHTLLEVSGISSLSTGTWTKSVSPMYSDRSRKARFWASANRCTLAAEPGPMAVTSKG